MIFCRMEHSLAILRKVMLQDPEQLEVMAQRPNNVYPVINVGCNDSDLVHCPQTTPYLTARARFFWYIFYVC